LLKAQAAAPSSLTHPTRGVPFSEARLGQRRVRRAYGFRNLSTAEFDRFEQATAALLVNGDWGSMAIEADVSPSIEPVAASGA